MLTAMGPIAWLLWPHKPAGSVAVDIAVFLTVVAGTFGLCGGLGWLASSIAWRMRRYSQVTAMSAFAAGAGMLLILNLVANSRIALVRPGPARAYASTRLASLPPVKFGPYQPRPDKASIPVTINLKPPAATQPAAPEKFTPQDLFAVLAVTDHTGFMPPARELDKLARGYFNGDMPAGLCQRYEEALRQGLLPDPRVGWTQTSHFDRWERVGELIKASHQLPTAATAAPTPAPAGDQDGDLPKDVFLKIKVINARYEFGDMHGVIERPDGWVISSIQIAVFPTGHPESRKIFTTNTWARPDEPSNLLHLYIRHVRGEFLAEPNITGFTWTVIRAKGHRAE
ncbi:MAG TPA: hypothetical protein VFW23_09940 [Tepidisphaeraceae bacterium]|nr:hypothetical protein [Tepidisphaeraceae bacterium]